MLNFDRSTEKHALQNVQNDGHQWLSHSFRVHHWGSLQHPRPSSWFKGYRLLRGGEGRGEEEGREEKVRKIQNDCHQWLSHSFRVHHWGSLQHPRPPSWFKGYRLLRGGEGRGEEEGREGKVRKIQNDCHQWLSHSFRMQQIRFRTPLGELTALPRPPSWFKGDRLLRGGEERWEEEGREGKGKNIQNDCHQWLSYSFRMHQIRFRPGLRPGPCWGSLQRSPRPSSWFKRDLLPASV